MKKLLGSISLYVLMAILVTGCGKSNLAEHTGNSNNVDNVLNQQVTNSDNTSNTNSVQTDNSSEIPIENIPKTQTNKNNSAADISVDYDLTSMGSDMIYATVYQLMASPDEYIGKTIKMNGLYFANYYEPTKQYYHYCIIADATACCSQGIEFIWGDGSHVYPNDYPTDNTEIIVTGTFETYQEQGEPNLYCRLNNATLEIIE